MNGHFDPSIDYPEKAIPGNPHEKEKNCGSNLATKLDSFANCSELNVNERETKNHHLRRTLHHNELHDTVLAANFNHASNAPNHLHSLDKTREINGRPVNKNFKLLSDPILKKGAQKIFRYDGVSSQKDPPLIVKDPRPRLNLWGGIREPLDLIVPRFKIDKNYVGVPPAIEVSITNLNDNINKSFLEEMLRKFDNIEEIEIFYHPKSKKHLGLAKVIFMTSSGARYCVQKLNQASVMGNIINVFFDPFAKEITNIYEATINPKPAIQSGSAEASVFVDPSNIDKLASTHSKISSNNDYGYSTEASRLSSDLSTPSTVNFDSQPFYSNQQQYFSDNQQWDGEKWTTREYSDRSPVRESLDVRIENLLREHRGTGFLSEMDHLDFESSFARFTDPSNHRRSLQKKIDDSDAILGTPPSPFMSASDFLKWHKITKKIDSGHDPYLESDEDDDKELENKSDDDDRMSMSSLSSGEKLEDANSLGNSLYNGDHSQMMSKLNFSWKNGLSHPNNFFHDKNSTVPFNTSLMPQYMYQSFVSRGGSHSFLGFSVPSTLGLSAGIFNEESPTNDEHRSNFPKNNELLFNDLLSEALQKCIKDLREILTKDIYKKIIENFSYKLYDQWWEESEKKSKKSNRNDDLSEKGESTRRSDIHIPLFNPLFENSFHNRQGLPLPNLEFGLTRGLRAAMPSFKRKIVRKSPSRSFSEISDDEDDRRRNYRRRLSRPEHERRRRRRNSVSSHNSHESSKSSSSSKTSSSSSAESKSDSSSSHSNASSSSSESEDRSDSESTSSESGSESDTSSSSSLSKASRVSSKSSKSLSSAKSLSSHHLSPDRKASPEIVSTLLDDSDEGNHTDSTATADEMYFETDEEIAARELGAKVPDLSGSKSVEPEPIDDIIGEVRKSGITSLLEFEATQALMALANSEPPIVCAKSEINNDQDSSGLLYGESGHELVLREHNYCHWPEASPEMPPPPPPLFSAFAEEAITLNKTDRLKRKQENEDLKRKRKKVKDFDEENLEPNVMAVASEWRKAKRKKLSSQFDDMLAAALEESNLQNRLEAKEASPQPVIFPARDDKAEDNILHRFLQVGIDDEDLCFLGAAFKRMLQEDIDMPWLNDVHWDNHPATYAPPPSKRRRLFVKQGIEPRIHSTGCARTEGWYKREKSEKLPFKYEYINVMSGVVAKNDADKSKGKSRDERLNQRRLISSYENLNTDVLKFNKMETRKKSIKFSKSRIHDWGLFAMENINPEDLVIEYVGVVVRQAVADFREKQYLSKGIGSSYLFKIDADVIIDATTSGNVARFINHSCDPNCTAKIIHCDGKKKIAIYAKRVITAGEEITYDYKFPEEEEKISCLCGSATCRGFLN